MNLRIYRMSNQIWLGGTLTITALSAFNEFFFNLTHVGSYVFTLGFSWFAS